MAKSNAAQKRSGKTPVIAGVRVACICAGLFLAAANAAAADGNDLQARSPAEAGIVQVKADRTTASVRVGERGASVSWRFGDTAATHRISQDVIRRLAPLVAQTIKAMPAIF